MSPIARKLNNLMRIYMKVCAKYQVAYGNIGYKAGDVFDMKGDDYKAYQNDVVKVSNREWVNTITKDVKSSIQKVTQPRSMDGEKNRELFEKETGKKAFWSGRLTKGYKIWLKER